MADMKQNSYILSDVTLCKVIRLSEMLAMEPMYLVTKINFCGGLNTVSVG